jgi:hypothetical protein
MHTDIHAQVGFEPTISVFERVETVHALDCAATVISIRFSSSNKNVTRLIYYASFTQAERMQKSCLSVHIFQHRN